MDPQRPLAALPNGTRLPPEQTFTQKTLGYMAGTLAVCLVAVIAGRVAGVFDNEPLVILSVMVTITGTGWRLARGPYWPLAGWFPIAIVFAVAAYASEAGQLSTYMVLFYGLAVLLAGALKSVRVTWVVMATAVAVHLALASPGHPLDDVLAVGLTFSGGLAGIVLIKTLFVGELRRALRRAESSADALAAEVQVRRRAEADLLDREQNLRAIVTQNSDGIAVADAGSRIVEWNPAMAKLTGLAREAVIGRTLAETLLPLAGSPEGHAPSAWCDALRQLAEGCPLDQTASCRDLTLVQPDGAERLADIRAFRVESPSGAHLVVSARDVTTQRRLETERERLAQLESIGVLAGGLAHELNNLLTSVRGNLSLAQHAARDGRVEPGLLDDADAACDRIHDLANRLLTFAKGGVPILDRVDVASCLLDAVAGAIDDPATRCVLEIPSDLPAVRADRNQLRQAFRHVIRNADQATAGTILIRAARLDAAPEGVLPWTGHTFVEISVSDQGPGIEHAVQARIFDPYFTTRPGHDGLGLTATYSILRRHGGHVRFESTPGRGTTFFLYVPADAPAAGTTTAAEAPLRDPARATATVASRRRVLVLDDEEAVRVVAVRMLERIGYDATGVADGLDAIRAYAEAAERGAPFDLVIADLTIEGGVGGVEAMQRIRARFPHVTAVVSSGYSSDPVMASPAEHGFADVVVKPYTMERLAETVASVLASPPGCRLTP